jgi:flagellar basal-body rod protein FlgF
MDMGIVELGAVIIAQATQRVESAAQNMANMTTPGYKARLHFQKLVDGLQPGSISMQPQQKDDTVLDFAAGKLQHTGNPLDLAISGTGFFTVRTEEGLLYTRSGQFARDADGRLTTPEGAVLQSTAGDVQTDGGDISVLADGTVQENGQPVSQLSIAAFDDPGVLSPVGAGLFSAPSAAARDTGVSHIHQGMLEASNVTTANEMISLMAGLRGAETGQRVIQVYDDLMGRALTAFGQT